MDMREDSALTNRAEEGSNNNNPLTISFSGSTGAGSADRVVLPLEWMVEKRAHVRRSTQWMMSASSPSPLTLTVVKLVVARELKGIQWCKQWGSSPHSPQVSVQRQGHTLVCAMTLLLTQVWKAPQCETQCLKVTFQANPARTFQWNLSTASKLGNAII